MFSLSWTSALTDQVRLSVVIAGTRHPATLMTPAYARQQGIEWDHSIRAEDIDNLVRKGMRSAQSKRIPAVRLQLAGSRGRPQERVLVVAGIAAPVPSRSGKSGGPARRSVRTRTQPIPSTATDLGKPRAQQSRQLAEHEHRLVEVTQALSELQVAFAEQVKRPALTASQRMSPRLQETLRLLEARTDKLEELVETMAPMVEGLRQQWRASQGHAPTATGLPRL